MKKPDCICYRCNAVCVPIGEYDGSWPRDLRCPVCGMIFDGDTYDPWGDIYHLKDCPFCGADSCNVGLLCNENLDMYIYCASCDSIYVNADNTIESLIKGWNRRDADVTKD